MSDVTISRDLLAYMMGKLQMVGQDAGYLRAAQDAYYCPAPVQVPEGMVLVRRKLDDETWKRLVAADVWPVTPQSFQRMLDVLAAAPAATVATEVEHSFGNGEKVVCRGTHGGRPAVFIAPAKMPGAVGEDASRENAPRDRLVAGEIVLTFPTEAQAVTVEAALLNEAIAALESRPTPAVQVPSGWRLVPSRCPLCEYQHGHKIGCENNPVDIALRAAAPSVDAELLDEDQFAECEALLLAAAPSAPAVAYETWSQEQVDAIKAEAAALLPKFKSKPVAHEAGAQGVDVEKVMALVEEYKNRVIGACIGDDRSASDADESERLLSEIRALLSAPPAASGWIPVGERLPDMDAGYVIVHCEGGKIADDFFCRNREFLHHAGNRYSRKHQGKESGYFRCAHEYGYRITHWQPLPPPPAIANQEPSND